MKVCRSNIMLDIVVVLKVFIQKFIRVLEEQLVTECLLSIPNVRTQEKDALLMLYFILRPPPPQKKSVFVRIFEIEINAWEDSPSSDLSKTTLVFL